MDSPILHPNLSSSPCCCFLTLPIGQVPSEEFWLYWKVKPKCHGVHILHAGLTTKRLMKVFLANTDWQPHNSCKNKKVGKWRSRTTARKASTGEGNSCQQAAEKTSRDSTLRRNDQIYRFEKPTETNKDRKEHQEQQQLLKPDSGWLAYVP